MLEFSLCQASRCVLEFAPRRSSCCVLEFAPRRSSCRVQEFALRRSVLCNCRGGRIIELCACECIGREICLQIFLDRLSFVFCSYFCLEIEFCVTEHDTSHARLKSYPSMLDDCL